MRDIQINEEIFNDILEKVWRKNTNKGQAQFFLMDKENLKEIMEKSIKEYDRARQKYNENKRWFERI
ncbi:MAG: hypothetical protein MSH11_04665 [Ruminococcus sp.]|nr:hypothetical protein [Ruminococcus sp.]